MNIKRKVKNLLKKSQNLFRVIKVKSLSRIIQKSAFKSDKAYKSYIEEQIKKSYNKLSEAHSVNVRTTYLVDKLKQTNVLASQQSILCVGCRNANELDYIEKTLGLQSTGLDLFSTDHRIVVGDMHKMPFDDNFFDHLYSCHSLEHAYDIKVALQEFARVVKDGGTITIEVPVDFEPNETDYWDLKNDGNLFNLIKHNVRNVFLQETASNAGNSKKSVIRFIFSIKK